MYWIKAVYNASQFGNQKRDEAFMTIHHRIVLSNIFFIVSYSGILCMTVKVKIAPFNPLYHLTCFITSII